jgi:hypothetical protein
MNFGYSLAIHFLFLSNPR